MLLDKRIASALALLALASRTVADSDDVAHNQSVFAFNRQIAFGVTIPNDSTNDVYFSLVAKSSVGWAAIGLGSTEMAGSLVLMVYPNAKGDNVTFSPRLSTKHAEPVYYPGLKVDLQHGTGLVNGTYVVNGICHNCRTWSGGSIDVKKSNQAAIYATGPGSISSDDPANSVVYHDQYGQFNIDLKAATGPAGVPVLENLDVAASSGATLVESESGKQDWPSIIHAIAMVLCFVGLMPFGILLLRVGGLVRWHGINQGVSAVGVIIGAGLGVYISLYYTRSKSFNSAHQLIGIVVTIGIIGQFLLGFFHHRIYKRTQAPTKLAQPHVWFGRILIAVGVADAFLGFPLALVPKNNYILAGIVAAAAVIMLIILLWNMFRTRRTAPFKVPTSPGGPNPEPWRYPAPHSYPGQASNRYADYSSDNNSLISRDIRLGDMNRT